MQKPPDKAPIVLMTPPSGEEKCFHRDIGLAYIQAYLEERSVASVQFCRDESPGLNELVDIILSYEPKFLGLKIWDTNYYYAKLIAEATKRAAPDIKVIFGGPSATFSTDLIMNDCQVVDACVIYEGEQTCYDLMTTDFSKWSEVPGIVLRVDGELVRTAPRSQIKDGPKRSELDILPSPTLSGYMQPGLHTGLLTSRGCFYKCTFCNFSAIGQFMVRYHSPERIVDELRYVMRYAQEHEFKDKVRLEFYDDALTLNMKRSKEMFRAIIDSGDIDMHFIVDTRGDFMDDELLDLMAEAGVVNINFGLESASVKVLKTIKKARAGLRQADKPGLDEEYAFLENMRDTIKRAKARGISPSVSVIVGLPGETPEEALKTLEMVKELDVYEYNHNILRIYSGTELFETYKEYGLGIEHSGYVLPFVTKIPYNVRDIKPLPNATAYQHRNKLLVSLMSLFSGEYRTFGMIEPMAVFFDGLPEQNPYVETFLKNFPLPCGTSLYFAPRLGGLQPAPESSLSQEDYGQSEEENIAGRLQKGIERSIITTGAFSKETNLIIRWQEDGAESWKMYPDLTGVDSLKKFGHEIEFDSLSRFMDKVSGKDDLAKDHVAILETSTTADVETFTELKEHDSYEDLSKVRKNSNVFFSDYCRFDCTGCPQLQPERTKPRRLFVKENGKATICASDRNREHPTMELRTESESAFLEDFHAMQERWLKVQKERGCAACPVRDSCAKCLNPHPLSAEQYCHLMLNGEVQTEEEAQRVAGVGDEKERLSGTI
tara:strand:+ start:2161 stop:4479 length:2319 start_codon:yes stop_codon:yes gene_type:complete